VGKGERLSIARRLREKARGSPEENTVSSNLGEGRGKGMIDELRISKSQNGHGWEGKGGRGKDASPRWGARGPAVNPTRGIYSVDQRESRGGGGVGSAGGKNQK